MLVVPVHPKFKQKKTDIDFAGVICTKDKCSTYHIDITEIDCDPHIKCKPPGECLLFDDRMSCSCECRDHVEEVEPAKWTMRYTADAVDGTVLTFEWCDLIWNLPCRLYDAVLYEDCEPCGRFAIQILCGNLYGSSKKAEIC